MASNILPMIFALILDSYFGDPINNHHPVVYMGKLISYLESKLYKLEDSYENKFKAGLALVLIASLSMLVIGLIIEAIPIRPLKLILKTLIFFYCLAGKTLAIEALEVKSALNISLEDGRRRVARIVGRDTNRLDYKGIVMATIETVAENTVDGITSPIFFGLLFGIPGALVYKIANTMDSMIAYRNDRYLYFGRAAARLDDILNFFPARLSALTSILAAPLLSLPMKEAFGVYLRDRYKHKSPNSAQSEAAFAGLLGVKLGGPTFYKDGLVHKEFLNERGREVTKEDIERSIELMNYTWIIFTGLMILFILILIR